jgi:hypothetical protein
LRIGNSLPSRGLPLWLTDVFGAQTLALRASLLLNDQSECGKMLLIFGCWLRSAGIKRMPRKELYEPT